MSNRYYLHIDADAFFASVEQCIHHELKGKPVVTGREGSMVVALSYEAKALGIERGIPTHIVQKEYPNVYMVASDYQMYRIYSQRMISIIKEYEGEVEQLSIDECRVLLPTRIQTSEEAKVYALRIQKDLNIRLGCTFSFGISTTPLIAKIASGLNKPSGCTVITPSEQYDLLTSLSVSKVPGFGRSTTPKLQQLGVGTIGQFINRYHQIAPNFSVTLLDVYQELTGTLSSRRIKHTSQSINRARSFPPTKSRQELQGQMASIFEYLMRKLRGMNRDVTTLYLSVRDRDRVSSTYRVTLPSPRNDHDFLLSQLQTLFEKAIKEGSSYRYLSVTFSGLKSKEIIQHDLFGEHHVTEREHTLWNHIDASNRRFGKESITTANSLIQPKQLGSHLDHTNPFFIQQYPLLPGEQPWKRLRYPYLGKV